MERFLVNFDDLMPVAHGQETDKVVLYVRKEDLGKSDAVGVLVDTDCSKQEYAFGLAANFLSFGSYDGIDTKNDLLVGYYRDRLSMTFPDDAILDLLERFRDELEKWNVLENKYDYPTSMSIKITDAYEKK